MKPLTCLTKQEYQRAKDSGMFWEYYPEATGNFLTDVGEGKMEIDIRNGLEDEVKSIRFSDADVIKLDDNGYRKYVEFHDSDGNVYPVHMDDIDNLIKALEHAKKIWS